MTSRRQLLLAGSSLLASGLFRGFTPSLFAQQAAALDVASAGSFRAMLEGPLKAAAAQSLRLDLRAHSQGADAVAKSLLDGTLAADVFIPITASPMLAVMRGGAAVVAEPIARTELVIVYSPKSRFAPQLAAAAESSAKGGDGWLQVLQSPGLRLARSNPAADPGGRAILFALMLAAKKYNQPKLVETVLGDAMNPAQVGAVKNPRQALESGEIDVMASYKTSVDDLPCLALPADVNLSGNDLKAKHPDVSLTLGGKVFYPESLMFYAAVLKKAANPAGAAAFVAWLKGEEAQGILRSGGFDAPGDAAPLHP
ncbi:substrate-binding domain-containing protein [Silvibacterium acidisoli]|uniref:substrate-binding domain-containing protein n=1 Tax=Acidobacteriaceae bacterium ZG23-2 TaxID=2883246 RepID=UPI00406C3E5B